MNRAVNNPQPITVQPRYLDFSEATENRSKWRDFEIADSTSMKGKSKGLLLEFKIVMNSK